MRGGTAQGGLIEARRASRRWGLELHGRHGEYSAFIFLIGRKRFEAFFVRDGASRRAVETIRKGTLMAQPFANLSKAFKMFFASTATDAAVNSAPKNGVDHP
jgi:hypothetical protein